MTVEFSGVLTGNVFGLDCDNQDRERQGMRGVRWREVFPALYGFMVLESEFGP